MTYRGVMAVAVAVGAFTIAMSFLIDARVVVVASVIGRLAADLPNIWRNR